MAAQHRRRVGAVRPSHLMYTSGVGALVDLPNFSVLVNGLDDWNYAHVLDPVLHEPRLLDAVQRAMKNDAGEKNTGVTELRLAPWVPGTDRDPAGPAALVGVPSTPFPGWLRCTACDQLAPVDSGAFRFDNDLPRRPQDARFQHVNCGHARRRKPLAVAARFVLACTRGHLDEFPYRWFTHHGDACPQASHPTLRMTDRGANLGANVELACVACGARRNVREAMGRHGRENLPRCRGRHPHLSTFEPGGCPHEPKVIVVGASNQWFAQTLSALHVPPVGVSALNLAVEKYWENLRTLLGAMMLPYAREQVPALAHFVQWDDAEVWEAIERHRAKLSGGAGRNGDGDRGDLRTAEWEAFTDTRQREPDADFTLRREPVPAPLRGFYADVVQAERLREVRAMIGFTRLDAPDPEDIDLVARAPLCRGTPSWVPAGEVRGEGIFVKLPEELLGDWEARVSESEPLRAIREAYVRFQENRYSDRIGGDFDPMRRWPGARYIALHTLSHLLIRTIALECGYNSASLSERIYPSLRDDRRSGILIYTAVPDAEGTLGGLVTQAEPDRLVRLTRRALADARHCSSDPLCAERLPEYPADFLHGAACHVCLFVSETTCERGNRFLDRRFVVPIDRPELALFPTLP